MQNNAPQQPQCQLVISINDVGSSNIHQLHLERLDQLYIKHLSQLQVASPPHIPGCPATYYQVLWNKK